MKLLLASAGITNASIRSALDDLLGKPIADSTALCIPTASYGMRGGGSVAAWRFIAGQERSASPAPKHSEGPSFSSARSEILYVRRHES